MRTVFSFLLFLSGPFILAQSPHESFNEKINRHFYLAQYDSVISYYELTQHNETDPDSIASTLNLVAKCYYYLGRNNASLATYEKIYLNPPQNPAILAKIYCTYSEVLIETAQYELADSLLLSAENILLKIDRPDLKTLMHNNRGVWNLRTSRHSEALIELNKAIQIALRIDDSKLRSLILNNIGIVHYDIGNYQDALIAFKDALKLDLTFETEKDLAADYLNIGNVYCELNDNRGSIEFFQKAKDAYAAIQDSSGMSLVLGNLSTALIELKKYSQAEDALREAIQIARLNGDRLGEAEWLFSLALVAYKKGNYAESYVAMERVGQRFLSLESYLQYGKTLVHLGKCKQKLCDYTESERLLLLAYKNYHSKNLEKELWDVQSNLAEVYGLIGRDGKADSLYKESITGIENSRTGLATELTTYFIENDRLEVYRSYVNFLITQNRLDDAFDILEKAKARNLDDFLQKKNYVATNQSAIADSCLLIEYFLHDRQSYVFVKSAQNLKVIPIGKKEVTDRLIVDYLAQVKQKKKDRNAFLELSVKLYHEVWEPVEQELRSPCCLIIIPDERLYYLPFESLFDGQRFLAEKHELIYAPSATIARTIRKSKSQNDKEDRIAIFVQSQIQNTMYPSLRLDSLAYVGSEADKIKTIYLDRSEIFSEKTLTMSALSDSALAKSTIIHFAAHGINNSEKPEFSAIVLGQSELLPDGLLKANEIQKMKLRDKLVILSACETSVGTLLKGEGMLGLTRAFMAAGASSVVASIWNVYDESTAEFMQMFYRKKEMQKLSSSKALQQAKIDMIKSEKWRDPAFWAPFVLWGTGN